MRQFEVEYVVVVVEGMNSQNYIPCGQNKGLRSVVEEVEGKSNIEDLVDMDMVKVHVDQEEGMEGHYQGTKKGLDSHMDVVKNHNCPLIRTIENRLIEVQDLIFHAKGSHPRWN